MHRVSHYTMSLDAQKKKKSKYTIYKSLGNPLDTNKRIKVKTVVLKPSGMNKQQETRRLRQLAQNKINTLENDAYC